MIVECPANRIRADRIDLPTREGSNIEPRITYLHPREHDRAMLGDFSQEVDCGRETHRRSGRERGKRQPCQPRPRLPG